MLTPVIIHDHNMNITPHVRPIEANLKNLSACFRSTYVSSISKGMTMVNKALEFLLRDTTTKKAIRSCLEEKGFILIKIF